jgi:SAM-dependent methyltransferase
MDKRERRDAKCPRCGEVERARLLFLVLSKLLVERDCAAQSALHVAPENALRLMLKRRFGSYVSADLRRRDVDRRFDIQSIPFPDASFDLVLASYVLEYAADDRQAMAEIRRVLRPGGIAVLPFPVMQEETLDLSARDARTGHMHDPGIDYIDRLRELFARVDLYWSEDFPARHQLMTFRGEAMPDHPLSRAAGWHTDFVPVCHLQELDQPKKKNASLLPSGSRT